MHKVPVGVLGASGYSGRELCGLISEHPGFDLVFAAANSQRGQRMRVARRELEFVAQDDAPLESAELIFTALPHGTSADWVKRGRSAGARIVDLSSDYRPGNAAPSEAPYGLPELLREAIKGAEIVANPGCYATAVLIALAPLIRRRLVPDGATISISAASGVTGAGYAPRPELLFAEISEDFRAYNVTNEHRHLAEMRSVVQQLGGDVDLLFIPHLLPVARGILATITVPLADELTRPNAVWEDEYRGEPFVEITAEPPALRDVVRRNAVRVSAASAANVRRPMLVITAALDNLVKGAAGQAVQNANIMSGFEETAGLPS